MSAKKAKRVGTTTVESAATTSPDVDVLKNTILITKQAVKAKGWSFVQSNKNKYAFYIYAKDTNAKTKDNGASYLNKGVGMVITFPATFPASPPSVYLIGVDHPHVASSAITDMNNGGHYCTHRFNSSVWSSNNCTGEAFADTVVNAILDLDNKAPNWSSPYPHHSQAKWTRAACLTKSVAAPTLPASFT